MHVPGWLLLILISYLTDRSMFMRFKGASSSKRELPGSSPQGTFLAIILFITIFNGAALRPRIPKPLCLNFKYVDDLILLHSINLKSSLMDDPVRNCRTLIPDGNKLQDELNELMEFVRGNLLKINHDKTKVMKFNVSKTYNFLPELFIDQESGQLVLLAVPAWHSQ